MKILLLLSLFIFGELSGAVVTTDLLFTTYRQNNRSFYVGLESNYENTSTALIWDGHIREFQKRLTMVELPPDANNVSTLLSRHDLQVIDGKSSSNSFLFLFEDGELVNFPDFGGPYHFAIPALKGAKDLRVYRNRVSLNDQFTFLEDEERGLYFAFNHGQVFKVSRSIKDAPAFLRFIKQNGRWTGLEDSSSKRFADLVELNSSVKTTLLHRPMTEPEVIQWNERMIAINARNFTINDTASRDQVAGSSVAYPVIHRMYGGRYVMTQIDERLLAVVDNKLDQKTVREVRLKHRDIKLSDTGRTLLIFYPALQMTETLVADSFEPAQEYHICMDDLVKKPKPKKRRQR